MMLTEQQLRIRLGTMADDIGQRRTATALGTDGAHVNHMLSGTMPISSRVAEAMGFEKVSMYRQIREAR